MALPASRLDDGFYPSSPIVRTKRTPRRTSPPLVRARGLGSSVRNAAGAEKLEQNLLISETSGRKRRGVVGVARTATEAASENLSGGYQILLSDVVVKRRRRVYLGRKWNSLDIATAGVILFIHLLCLFAPFTFNWGAFWVAVALYVVTGLFGITLSFHRNLTHRSFKLPRWLEFFFAYCGVPSTPGVWTATVTVVTTIVLSIFPCYDLLL